MKKIYIAIILLVILLLIVIKIVNKIKTARIKVNEASSGIDIALAKRYDVLTKMVEVVKGYTKHEKETLINIANVRNKMSIEEKNTINNEQNEAYNKICILVEKYPELKASENYLTLQKAIIDVEEHLSAARRLYNANVTNYNQLIEIFPTNIVAMMYHMKPTSYFSASDEEKKKIEL